MMLIIFQLNSNQWKILFWRVVVCILGWFMSFYALILFSAQWWCRIDAEAYYMFYINRDHSAACQRAAMLGYVNGKAWVKLVPDNFC